MLFLSYGNLIQIQDCKINFILYFLKDCIKTFISKNQKMIIFKKYKSVN